MLGIDATGWTNPTSFLLAPLAGKFSKIHKATKLGSRTFRGSFESFRQVFNPPHLDIGVPLKSVFFCDGDEGSHFSH